jgi:hypothetical protein
VSCSQQPVIRGHALVLSFFIFDILPKVSRTRRSILAPVAKPIRWASETLEQKTLEQNFRQSKILPAAALATKLTSG